MSRMGLKRNLNTKFSGLIIDFLYDYNKYFNEYQVNMNVHTTFLHTNVIWSFNTSCKHICVVQLKNIFTRNA